MSISIREIAENLDVSIATVSRAINGRGRINPEVKRRVILEAKRLNYKPKMQAPVQTLGLLTQLPYGYVAQVDSAIIRVFSDNGWVVETFTPDRSDKLLGRFIEGVIALPTDDGAPEIIQKLKHTPTVLFNCPGRGQSHAVVSDHAESGYLAGKAFVEAGHRKVVAVFQDSERGRTWQAEERLEGFLRAFRTAGIELPPERIIYGQSDKRAEAIETALDESPTALFLGDEYLTPVGIGIIQGKRRLRIPEDISVIGFNTDPYMDNFFPRLTSIVQPLEAMAVKALNILERLTRQPDLPYETHIFPNELRQGATVASPSN